MSNLVEMWRDKRKMWRCRWKSKIWRLLSPNPYRLKCTMCRIFILIWPGEQKIHSRKIESGPYRPFATDKLRIRNLEVTIRCYFFNSQAPEITHLRTFLSDLSKCWRETIRFFEIAYRRLVAQSAKLYTFSKISSFGRNLVFIPP